MFILLGGQYQPECHSKLIRKSIKIYRFCGGQYVPEYPNALNVIIFVINFILDSGIYIFATYSVLNGIRIEDQEISILSLHLLQNCMVYINTLMIQQV